MPVSIYSRPITALRGTDVFPTDLDSSAIAISDWSYPNEKYGAYIEYKNSTTYRSLYIENSIDFKSSVGTGLITLVVPSSGNANLNFYWPTQSGTLATQTALDAKIAEWAANNILVKNNDFTNRNTFSRLPSGASTLTTATTLATTYALNMEISTSSDVTLGITGSGGSHYLSTVQVKPQSLVVNASNIAAEVSALHITGAPTKISGTGTATSAYGLKISSTGGTGFDSAYGAYITQPSGATTNVALEMILAVKTYTGSTPTLTTGYQSSLRMSQKSVSDILTTFIEFPTVMATLASPASSVLTAAPWNLSFKGSTTSFLGTAQSYTANFFTGDFIKTIKIGTGGTSSNTQNITIGSGAVGTTRIYAQVGVDTSASAVSINRLFIQGNTEDFTLNIANNQAESGVTKTIEIGSRGLATSRTGIMFGTSQDSTDLTHPTESFIFGKAKKNSRKGIFAVSSLNNNVSGSNQISIYVLSAIQKALVNDLGELGGTTLTSDEDERTSGAYNEVFIPNNSTLSFEIVANVRALDIESLKTTLSSPLDPVTNLSIARSAAMRLFPNLKGSPGLQWGSTYYYTFGSTTLPAGADAPGIYINNGKTWSPPGSAFFEVSGVVSCDANGKVTIQKITKQSCSRPYGSIISSTTSLKISTKAQNILRITGAGIGVNYISGVGNWPKCNALSGPDVANTSLPWSGSCSAVASTDGTNTGLLTISGIDAQVKGRVDNWYEDDINSPSHESGWLQIISELLKTYTGNFPVTVSGTTATITGFTTAPVFYANATTGAPATVTYPAEGAASLNGPLTVVSILANPTRVVLSCGTGSTSGNISSITAFKEPTANTQEVTNTFVAALSAVNLGSGLFHHAYGQNLEINDDWTIRTDLTYSMGPTGDKVNHPNYPYGSGTVVRCPQWGLGRGTVILYQKALDLAAGEVAGGKGRYVIYPKPSRDLYNVKMFAFIVPHMKWTATVKVTGCS